MSTDNKLQAVAGFFREEGWRVSLEPHGGRFTPDLLVEAPGRSFVVELKSSAEGRPERVIALLSQAILQARMYAREFPGTRPLALVSTRDCNPSLIQRVESFHYDFADETAIGIVDAHGSRYFFGDGLESISRRSEFDEEHRPHSASFRRASNLFSDLNQWLLKVLLAPGIPAGLLAAPRSSYRTAAQLAEEASVSTMTTSRFLASLREEGFLDHGRTIRLVRRRELGRRWKAHYLSSTPELPVRFVLPGSLESRLARLAGEHAVCLGLFDAALRLGVGHVEGVPPHLYVRSLDEALRWKALVPDERSPKPTLILKQAPAPESLFRGMVDKDGLHIADVIQIWLDSASHPSRGEEQSRYLERTVLKDVIGDTA
jgi:hypothetical protein